MKLILISNKPFTAAAVVDSDGEQTYEWKVGFTECGVIQPTVSAGAKYQYKLYFNSNRWVRSCFRGKLSRLLYFIFSVANNLNAIIQMNQVKFTCTFDSFEAFQKDGETALTISEGDMVDDIEKSISESLRQQVE